MELVQALNDLLEREEQRLEEQEGTRVLATPSKKRLPHPRFAGIRNDIVLGFAGVRNDCALYAVRAVG